MTNHARDNRERSIPDPHCADPACEFYGKPWQQGVCFNDRHDWDRLVNAGIKVAEEILAIRTGEFADKPEEYIRYLEAMYETAMMNWTSTLDECVALRLENRRLREAEAARKTP